VHRFHELPIIPFVNLTRSLTCQLMLEIFTRMELLKAGQRSLVLLEDRMDDISAQIGASETLNVYCDLVFQLRQWVRSYSGNCLALCEETFISSRYHTIDMQLALSNYSKHGYYNQLRFPYYKSLNFGKLYFCYTICVDVVDISVIVIGSVAVLLFSAIARVIFKKQFEKKKLLQIFFIFTFWYCFVYFLYSAFVLSLYIVLSVRKYVIGIPLSKLMSDNRPMKLLFYIVLFVILYGALILTFRKDASMIHFLYICIAITDIYETV